MCNRVIYDNCYFETGTVSKKDRKDYPDIPSFDTVYLRIEKIKNLNDVWLVMTYDEMAALAMLMSETVWKNIPRPKKDEK